MKKQRGVLEKKQAGSEEEPSRARDFNAPLLASLVSGHGLNGLVKKVKLYEPPVWLHFSKWGN